MIIIKFFIFLLDHLFCIKLMYESMYLMYCNMYDPLNVFYMYKYY